jgi:hypothetical protein
LLSVVTEGFVGDPSGLPVGRSPGELAFGDVAFFANFAAPSPDIDAFEPRSAWVWALVVGAVTSSFAFAAGHYTPARAWLM